VLVERLKQFGVKGLLDQELLHEFEHLLVELGLFCSGKVHFLAMRLKHHHLVVVLSGQLRFNQRGQRFEGVVVAANTCHFVLLPVLL